MTDDEVIFNAARIQGQWPYLRSNDWRILGAVIGFGDDFMPLNYVRKNADFFGTTTAFEPAAQRLIDAGLIERLEIPMQYEYRGKQGRKDRIEIFYRRTKKPLIEQWVL